MKAKHIKKVLLLLAITILLMGLVSAATTNKTSTNKDTKIIKDNTPGINTTSTTTKKATSQVLTNNKTQTNKEIKEETQENTKQKIEKNKQKNTKTEPINVTGWETLTNTIGQVTADTTIKLGEGSYNTTETIIWDNPGITLTIDGNGQTINGNQKQVFRINNGSTLLLKNITITNAKSDCGGAIYNNGNLSITDSTLTNNQATATGEYASAEGGAIYNNGILTVTDSTLQDNIVTATGNGAYANAYGGAIYNNHGNLTITDSTLQNNQVNTSGEWAYACGGAIYNYRGNLTITDSTLQNNQANITGEAAISSGGAIYNYRGNLTIIDSTLQNNQVNATGRPHYSSGGAINNEYGNVTVTDSTLQNNQVIAIGESTEATGGAIYNFDGNLIINNSILQNNQVNTTGEGADAYGGAIDSYRNVTITNSTIQNNQAIAIGHDAKAYGGAITYTERNLTITNSTIQNNQAIVRGEDSEVFGGAIVLFYGSVTITESTLQNNQANATGSYDVADAYGGAIYIFEGSVTITESTLQNNQAKTIGHGDAKAYGGVIFNMEGTLNLIHSTLNNNQAEERGTIYDSYGNYNIRDTTFYKNTPENFKINEDRKIQLITNDNYISIGKFSIIADGNEIGTGTGEDALAQFTILDEYKNVEVVINGTDEKTINNRYILRGFSVEVHNYTELIEVILKAHSENYDNLLIYLLPGDYNATQSISWDESATKNLIINGNGLTLDGNNLHQFIRVGSGQNLTLTYITITNYTTKNGGAIYNNGNLNIKDSTLTNNQAIATGQNEDAYGGAIYNNRGNVTITDSIIQDNKVTTAGQYVYAFGGAIYNTCGNVTITDSIIQDNKAIGRAAEGGAIYNWNGTITITHTSLTNNTVIGESISIGGTIFNGNGNLTIIDSTLTDNQATGDSADASGGAIFTSGLTYNYNITDTIFYNNTPANFIINEENKIQLINTDKYISIGKFSVIADGEEIGTGTGVDDLELFTIQGEYNNVEVVINGTDERTLNNRYMLRGFSVEVHNYTELVEAILKAQSENYNSIIINLLPGDYNATQSINWEESETKNLIIKGNNITIDGKDIYQFIKVGNGLNLTLVNVVLTNFKADNGGAIDNRGHLTIINSSFVKNTATHSGGAIYSENLLNITASEFIQNSASSGAAIYFNGNAINLSGSNFILNTASVDGETLKLVGERVTVEDNIYDSTGIAFKTVNLTVNDNQQYYLLGENIVLNFTIELEHPESYDADILEKLDKTIYINIIEKVTTKNNSYMFSNPELGEYTIIYKINHNISNTVKFNVVEIVSEISTPEKVYDYYNGLNNNVTININDESGEKGSIIISVKDNDKYNNLLIYPNIKDKHTLTTETIAYALKTLYDNLNDSYIIKLTYTNDYVIPSSTEFTLNIIKQRNTSIIYNILNNTEGNLQINITVTDTVSNTPINDATIKITGDINQNTTTGIITDTTLTPGNYTINVLYYETDNYKSSEATINFNVEIDKDKKIEELEEQVENQNNTIQEQNNTINDLNTTVQEQEAIINELNNIIQEQTGIINTLNDTLNYMNNTIQEQATTINELNNTVQEQASTINDLNNTVQDLQKQIDELKAAKNTTIILDEITDAKYNENITISGSLVNEDSIGLFNQVVTLTIGESEVNVTTKGGIFEYTTLFKEVGEKTVTATYKGTDKYKASEATITFDIEKQDIIITYDPFEDVKYKDNITVTGRITDINGNGLGKVNARIGINGKLYKAKTDRTGAFTFTTTATTPGINNVTLSYAGNANYNSYKTSTTFKVEKQDILITYDTIEDVKYKENITITGRIVDVNGNALGNINALININGKQYKAKTDSTGAFIFTITANTIGTNNITISYDGNNNYNAYVTNTTFNVEKQDITITYDPIEDTLCGENVSITGTVSDVTGNGLGNINALIRINGKLFKAKTDKTGAFTFTTTATTLGTNNVTISYGGNVNYNSYETSTTFIVIAKTE